MPVVFDVDRISPSFLGLSEPCRRFDAVASLLFGWLKEIGLPFSSVRHTSPYQDSMAVGTHHHFVHHDRSAYRVG